MTRKKWKSTAGILIGLIMIAALIPRLTRSVPPFQPPDERQLSPWGSLDSGTAQRLQAILDEDVNRIRVPGLQAFVRTPEGKTWSGTSGTTDLARDHLLRRDHVLRVGSVTKTFTAVLILKLVEEGRLSLDDPIEKWFPGFPSAEAITVRHLLNQSSGIPEIIPKVMLKSIIPSTSWEPEELVDIVDEEKPNFAPGSRFEYSNTNYILLGRIAEEASGKPAVQLLHEQIIDPLDLEHTYFIPYEKAPVELVPGFDRDISSFPGMLNISPDNSSWATAAFTSGALASTADDLGVFYESLFAGSLLPPSKMTEMTTFIPASNPGFSEQTGYGLGLMQLEVDGQELIGHVGQFMGSTAIAMYAPDKHYLIVVTSNLSNASLVEVLADLQESIEWGR
ncbi:MAG: serine hydrolase domain-containing protein [Anaerolineales bacterium]